MKKLFSILAIAVLALAFVSCENEKGGKYFKITGEVTDSTAHVTITPADTTWYYGIGAYTTQQVAQYTLDTLLAYDFEELKGAYEGGYPLDEVAFKGEFETTFDLPANFSFVIFAYQIIEGEDGSVSLGGWDKKIITTKSVKVLGERNLGEFVGEENTDCEDYRDYDGSVGIYGWNEEDSVEVGMCIYDDDFKGSYNSQDLDKNYSYVWVGGEYGLPVVDCSLKGTVNASAGTGTLKGWALCYDGIKYKFSITYTLPTEEPAPAPAHRIAAKKVAAAPANNDFKQLKIKRFRK